MIPIKQVLNQVKSLHEEIQKNEGLVKYPPTSEVRHTKLQELVNDADLYKAVAKLFYDGHHAQAVEKAFKFLNNLVKKNSGIDSADGSGLMKSVFSAQNPVLCLNALSSKSEKDEQLGYMEIFSGVMTGIRNPRAHEHEWEDTEERAIELLCLANHLVQKVRNASKPSSQQTSSP
jgi:uncharacterized protein (TIGR02391 family)